MKKLSLIALLVGAAATAQAQTDSTAHVTLSGEINLASSNIWLLNGVAYGVNEPNLALTGQVEYQGLYAYVYKANTLVKPISDGNYAMLALGKNGS